MGDNSIDPVDHSRTTRAHAGETMKNGANAPGLVMMAVAIVCMVVGLGGAASGTSTLAVIALPLAGALAIAGGAWLFLAHRRVRQQELDWAAAHPRADVHPPTS